MISSRIYDQRFTNNHRLKILEAKKKIKGKKKIDGTAKNTRLRIPRMNRFMASCFFLRDMKTSPSKMNRSNQ
jgi:hypothetical protein